MAVPVFTNLAEAHKSAAEIKSLGIHAVGLLNITPEVRVIQRADGDVYTVCAVLRDPRTGNVVVRAVAPGEMASEIVAAMKFALKGRAKATRSAVAREKERT